VTSNTPVRNWAGNVEFRAERVHRPSSVEQLCALVADARRVRVLGTGHSFNRIADTDADLIRTDGLPAEVEIDAAAGTATVAAGMRLAELSARLHAAGFALANLPSLPHISLAGAVATGTHGSGDGNQNLAAFVRAIRLVGPDGNVVELARGSSADFPGAVVALGALGVVTHLTVAVQPTFDVAQYVLENVSLDQAIERREEVFAGGYSVSVFTDWASGRGAVWRKLQQEARRELRQEQPQEQQQELRALGESVGRGEREGADEVGAAPEPEFLGGRLARSAAHPVPGMPAGNCTQQLGVPGPWHERLPHFRPEFTPSSGEELQSEFFVARQDAGEALKAVQRLGTRVAPVLQISEIRTIAADDLWLSPAYGRDSVALHFTWIADRAAVTPVLREIEQALAPLDARPHWGKVYAGGPAAAIAGYERADDFRQLMQRYDPDGKFRNEFVQRLFG
jgi:xylitol oxidase